MRNREEPSEEPAYEVAEVDEGAYLVCVVTAYARYGNVPYQGEVETASVHVRSRRVRVRFFADGDAEPCFADEPDRGSAYTPAGRLASGEKPDCAGVDGWYRDASCTEAFVDGTLVEDDLDLFACNRVELTYAQADRSCLLASPRAYYLDEACEHPLPDPSALLPPRHLHYGDRVSFARGASAWYEDMGRVREASCALGAYAAPDAADLPLRSARLTSQHDGLPPVAHPRLRRHRTLVI